MTEVGIRALKQNASAVVAAAVAGEPAIITDRGRKVAQLTALPRSPLQQLADAGMLRMPARRPRDIPRPEPWSGPLLSEVLAQMRDEERY